MVAGKHSRNHHKGALPLLRASTNEAQGFTHFPAKGHSKHKRQFLPFFHLQLPKNQQEAVRILSTPICIIFFILAEIIAFCKHLRDSSKPSPTDRFRSQPQNPQNLKSNRQYPSPGQRKAAAKSQCTERIPHRQP